MYDVIIVGARCAGAPLAMLLARSGLDVLLVDRASFPSEIRHGHFVHRRGPRMLREWGLLDKVAARTPAVASMVFDVGDFPLHVTDLVEDGLPWGFGPRRATLDAILVDAAVEAGAELRQGFRVSGFLTEGDGITGIRGRERDGRVVEERASIVVGADGRNSLLARFVRAGTYEDVPPLLCYYFSYWSGVDAEPFELYARKDARRVILAFRTEDDLYAVFLGLPMEEFEQARRDAEGTFMRALDLIPAFSERVRAGRREERIYGAGDLPNFYRKPYGPGWALVGDAGAHKDPYLALGICDAFRDVDLLARAIVDGLGGKRPLDEAFGEYERSRNAASADDYRENLAEARFTPMRPELLAMRAAVRNRPDDARQMIKARMGMIEREAFFNPQNIQRLLGSAPGVAPA